MTLKACIKLFLTQAACATAVLLGVLIVLERLAPGSVLPYFNFFWLVPVLVVLIGLAGRTREQENGD
ncbi:hypothetical protein FJZ48_02245 [Candidatus Uhrbacteria bacterium]|nr:hypothetical protein [Candidatus Uhrbacteria bacterium]